MEILGRKILPNINTALKLSPIVFLNGARQAGKSTLVQQLAADRTGAGEKIIYLSFDRPAMMAAAAAEPEAFLSAYPHPVIIDEVQMVPELFRPLKIAADELRRTDKPSL